MKTNYIVLAACCWMAGCATEPPPVTTHYETISGLRTDLMSENVLPTPGQPREVVWLNASRIFKNYRGDADYYLEVNYMAKEDVGYLEIPPGQTLTLIVDGETLKFDGNGSMNRRKVYRKEFVREDALYPVEPHHLQKIASAHQAKVLIKGNNGQVEREFAPENFERFRAFVNRFAM
jgi:hypothetical protein